MTKPIPDQSVFDFQFDSQENPFISEETFEKCHQRMKDAKAAFGYLRSPGMSGISQRALINRSPILKGREKWAVPLDMNIGNSSVTSIKVE